MCIYNKYKYEYIQYIYTHIYILIQGTNLKPHRYVGPLVPLCSSCSFRSKQPMSAFLLLFNLLSPLQDVPAIRTSCAQVDMSSLCVSWQTRQNPQSVLNTDTSWNMWRGVCSFKIKSILRGSFSTENTWSISTGATCTGSKLKCSKKIYLYIIYHL